MITAASPPVAQSIEGLLWCAVVVGGSVAIARRRWRQRRGRPRGLSGGRDGATRAAVEGHASADGDGPTYPPLSLGDAVSGAPADRPPMSEEALELLGRQLDFRLRLEVAVDQVASILRALPADRWRLAPFPLPGDRGNSLLLVGETGVFVLSATFAPGHWDDIVTVHRLAAEIQWLLPGYAGQVVPAICHPFSTAAPRLWHRAAEPGEWVGAWVLGGDALLSWLDQFRGRAGFSPADLERLDRLASRPWRRGAIPAAPSWPPVTAARVRRG